MEYLEEKISDPDGQFYKAILDLTNKDFKTDKLSLVKKLCRLGEYMYEIPMDETFFAAEEGIKEYYYQQKVRELYSNDQKIRAYVQGAIQAIIHIESEIQYSTAYTPTYALEKKDIPLNEHDFSSGVELDINLFSAMGVNFSKE